MSLPRTPHLILLFGLAYFAAMAPLAPGFATAGNLKTILAYLLPILVVAVGSTVVLVIGGMDLSVTSTIAMASVVGGKVMSAEGGWLAGSPWAIPTAVLAMLATGVGLGAFNGCVVVVCRIPPFIATLTSMMFLSGLAIWITLSRKIGGLPPGFLALGQNLWVAAAIAGFTAGIAHLALTRTLYGRWVFAVGQNAKAALVSGVPVGWVTFGTYVASGGFAGLSAVLFTAILETGNPEMARDNLLDVIGAVVLGGTSLFGGKGSVIGTVYGVVFLALVDNSLNLLGLTYYTILMVKGGVILGAAWVDAARNRLVGGAS